MYAARMTGDRAATRGASQHLEGVWNEARVRDAALRLRRHGGLAWLDADGSEPAGRRAFLGAAPVETLRVPWGADALEAIERIGRSSEGAAGVPRWIGYVAYDAFWTRAPFEPRMERDDRWPVLLLHRYDALIEVSVPSRSARIVADDDEALQRMLARLAEAPEPVGEAAVAELSVTPRARHAAAVEQAREHIAAGEVYQVNLARAWTGPFTGDPFALWLAMRKASPVPLGLYVDAGDHQVLARTMERFLEWHPDATGWGSIESRPIKGTIARHGADAQEAAALRADPKEHAEHAMIVDLVRNDLGRIAEVGSVEVAEPFVVEPYARLSHLVSTVRATTRPGTTLGDVLGATFPPGSVTGAPKSSALQIIEDLEPVPRGAYCGGVGFVDGAGGLSLAVAIRTAFVGGGQVRYHAGGGLVWKSDPQREVAETELKARVFLDALATLRDGGPVPIREEDA